MLSCLLPVVSSATTSSLAFRGKTKISNCGSSTGADFDVNFLTFESATRQSFRNWKRFDNKWHGEQIAQPINTHARLERNERWSFVFSATVARVLCLQSSVERTKGEEESQSKANLQKRWEAEWKNVIYIQFLVALGFGKLSSAKFSFHQRPWHPILMYAWIANSF